MARATADPNRQLISSEDVHGTEVYGADRKHIGEIDHLMIDKDSGRMAYAVISFGGFMGLGHSHYPVPWGALTYDTQLGGFRTNITEQQLKDAPEFSDDSWGDRIGKCVRTGTTRRRTTGSSERAANCALSAEESHVQQEWRKPAWPASAAVMPINSDGVALRSCAADRAGPGVDRLPGVQPACRACRRRRCQGPCEIHRPHWRLHK